MSSPILGLGQEQEGAFGEEFTMSEKLRSWRIGLIRRCKGGC